LGNRIKENEMGEHGACIGKKINVKVKVKQSHYRPGGAQRVLGS